MSLERQDVLYKDIRASATRFLKEWEHLKGLRDNFDACGGQDFFDAYFNQNPAPELLFNDIYGAMVAVNLIETAFLGGAKNLYKAKG